MPLISLYCQCCLSLPHGTICFSVLGETGKNAAGTHSGYKPSDNPFATSNGLVESTRSSYEMDGTISKDFTDGESLTGSRQPHYSFESIGDPLSIRGPCGGACPFTCPNRVSWRRLFPSISMTRIFWVSFSKLVVA